ncbi:hypothetical protein KMT30_09085 [Streptomyces sp. IBSBF 2953]|nr:hypothetical protein [Streptomyces hayashii]
MEHAGIAGPVGWISSIEILEDVWLNAPATVRFSRCNMFIGPNGVGKTHFLTLLSGLSEPSRVMQRAAYPDSAVHAAINWYDPQPRRAELKAEEDRLSFSLDGVEVPFVVQPYQVVSPTWSQGRAAGRLSEVARDLGLDPWNARRLFLSVPEIVGGSVKEVSIENDCIRAVCNLGEGDHRYDGAEQRWLHPVVVMEFVIALAETYARVKPTLLLLDGALEDYVHPRIFHHFSKLLSSPARTFQTVAVSMYQGALQNPDWTVTHFVPDGDGQRRNGSALPVHLVQDDDPLDTYAAWERGEGISEWIARRLITQRT